MALIPIFAACGEPPDLQKDVTVELEGQEERLYYLSRKPWPTPGNIRVCWGSGSGGHALEKSWVQDAVASSWESVSKVRFTGWGACPEFICSGRYCVPNPPEFGIVVQDTQPHANGLGWGLHAQLEGVVMNFTFNKWNPSCAATNRQREFCIRAIAVHEFGHVLGFAHEQNRPDTPAGCKDAPQGTLGDTLLTPWDADSVMNYCNVKWNNNGILSKFDIDGVQKVYGR